MLVDAASVRIGALVMRECVSALSFLYAFLRKECVMYPEKMRYENLQYGLFETAGKYDVPVLKGCNLQKLPKMIGFNYAKSEKEKANKGIHFFLDDYQFVRLWNKPYAYINLLKQFNVVFTPDFSLYNDFPKAMQIYNHYRKHWLGAYWESLGINVIPTICWGDKESFEWCFDGEPTGGTIAVSSVGTQNSIEARKLFLNGYNEMLCRLQPETVIFYGSVPDECRGNIIGIKAFQDRF